LKTASRLWIIGAKKIQKTTVNNLRQTATALFANAKKAVDYVFGPSVAPAYALA